MPFMLFIILLLTFAAAANAGQAGRCNIVNSDFEDGADANGIPTGWRLYEAKRGTVQCSLDSEVSHGGAKSVRMHMSESGQGLLISNKIPVALGEEFEASVWVLGEGLKAANPTGTVVFNGAFLRRDGRYIKFQRMGKMIRCGKWLKLSGTITVPTDVYQMVFQIGLKEAKGTLWFDDPAIVPKSLLGVRPAMGSSTLPPGSSDWNLEIMNRDGGQCPIRIKVDYAGKSTSVDVELDGSEVQLVSVPIHAKKSGKEDFRIRLIDPADGKVFVDKKLETRILHPVELDPLVPTHFCIEDGVPSVEARVWNHIPPKQIVAFAAELLDGSGRVLDRKDLGAAELGWQDVVFSAPGAGLGDYKVVTTMRTRDGETYTNTQPWHIIRREQALTTIDEDGLVVTDGKPLFPLGTFNSGHYALMVKTGFNTTHAWNRLKMPGADDLASIQAAKNYFDETQKAGMKAVGFLHVAYVERKEWDELRRRVRMFRNHPGLLAWCQEEGVARGEITMADLERLVKIVREEDPNHPFVLADSYDVITKVDRSRFFPENLMDIGMWWFYPIPLNRDVATSALEGQDASDGHTINPPTFMSATKKPIWVGLQAYKKPRRDGRFPTEVEYRCMAYLAVVHGAKGLLYYMGPTGGRLQGNTDENRPWGYLQDLVPELHVMLPVFMSPTAEEPVTLTPAKAPVDFILKCGGGFYTLIAVNRGSRSVNARFSTPSLGSGDVYVFFEQRMLRAENGKLADRFAPYGVHVYRWKSGI